MSDFYEAQADLSRLLNSIRGLSQARCLNDVMEIVRQVARELATADGATFILRDADQCCYVEEDAISPLWKGKRFPMQACISGWAMLHKQAVAIEDIYADSRIPADAYRPTFVKSLAMVPVRREDPLAAIGVYWGSIHLASKREMWLLQTLADCTALAMANVELYQDLKRTADNYEALYERSQRELADRKRLEKELRQAQKMEAIGRLAGGVAHDFNNVLSAVRGHAEFLLAETEPGSSAEQDVRQILHATETAATLTRQLLAFARHQVMSREVLDLNQVIERTLKLLRRMLGADILVSLQLSSVPPKVEADQGQLEQILLNLAVNARDAMPRGGKLTIESHLLELSEDYLSTQLQLQPGSYALVAVSDTGTGMRPEVLARVFEPFFTTKGVGKGSGLGLATVYGIVRQLGGDLHVYSEEGHGSTFKIYLPSTQEPVSRAQTTAAAPSASSGGECILLVEDDPLLLPLTSRIFRNRGYCVHAFASSEIALQQFHQLTPHPELILTDVVMPVMSGPEFVRQLHAQKPSLPVLYMSGYTSHYAIESGLLEGEMPILQKPFSQAQLCEKVREALLHPVG